MRKLLIIALFTISQLYSASGAEIKKFVIKDGLNLSIEICSDKIIRIKLDKEKVPKENLLDRYGILKGDWEKTNFVFKDGKQPMILTRDIKVIVNTQNATLTIQKANGMQITQIAFPDSNGDISTRIYASLTKSFGASKTGGGIIGDANYTTKTDSVLSTNINGRCIEFALNSSERFYGGGSTSRKNIQHRGEVLSMNAKYQKTDAPIPFVMSSNGWGILNNETVENFFDIGSFDANKMFVCNQNYLVDFYLIVGEDMPAILDGYTTISGKPYLLPKWAYGQSFGGNMKQDQFGVFDDALRFRENKIPIDGYWLEPQWMKKNYDFSTAKEWNDLKFTTYPFWSKESSRKYCRNYFIGRMNAMGYKLALWLCIDHDFSIEEEDQIGKLSGAKQSGQEHWFDHLMNFVDQGVAGFKLDPGKTLDPHPDWKYYNGFTDREMHNLQQVLMPKNLQLTFRNHTGKRAFIHYCGSWTGTQHWSAFTTGDNGLSSIDILNHSMSGSPLMAPDGDPTVKTLHFIFFSPWVQMNSWAAFLQPWLADENYKKAFKDYSDLRYSLIPYIYSASINSSLTAMPVLRPMPLVYPNDQRFDNVSNQFMFGDNLLVSVLTDKVILPEGTWIDYWTGKKLEGNKEITYNVPESRGGGLFIKNGAIIPYQKAVQFIDSKSVDTLMVRVYPHKESKYSLLEDDGISFDYEKGKISQTDFICIATNSQITFNIAHSKTGYVITKRHYQIEIATDNIPQTVSLNNSPIQDWTYDKVTKTVSLTIDGASNLKNSVVLAK